VRVGREQQLLIVLAVDIGQRGRQVLEQGDGHRAAADEGARLAAREHFAFDEEFAILGFEAGGFEEAADGGVVAHIEDAGDARAGFAGADHLGEGASAEEKTEGVDDDGFAAAGFSGQQVQAAVESDAEALDDRVVFDGEFSDHVQIIANGALKHFFSLLFDRRFRLQ